ncbi:uncharacterized protein LOC117747922 isoform X2 [Cyclopterus lumpus]|uniref:uncharacterized protein LOC117747922 isoform X2 n=1 Tax=Cyclopterus lumpus TaxID=8103 RepID=UPI001485E9A2|nr:uncharacterized protein LOC117747922 isoform X2 [Cyclopterus lumpus]
MDPDQIIRVTSLKTEELSACAVSERSLHGDRNQDHDKSGMKEDQRSNNRGPAAGPSSHSSGVQKMVVSPLGAETCRRLLVLDFFSPDSSSGLNTNQRPPDEVITLGHPAHLVC